ncbi:hypothetical protein E2562_032978 [Oryza meyeriana var. granulata]|uniref:Uncharacterized protein n=1 Tax=Oryza meyeriana var. granulata TaxID=110450 RepID=A0A6G1DA47_9ORYZ|nr:hypothetical protein E2562_032978 [Oryza meyeriana var. granulata]
MPLHAPSPPIPKRYDTCNWPNSPALPAAVPVAQRCPRHRCRPGPLSQQQTRRQHIFPRRARKVKGDDGEKSLWRSCQPAPDDDGSDDRWWRCMMAMTLERVGESRAADLHSTMVLTGV